LDQNLRSLFDRALADEPEPPPAELANLAMATGTSLRRRRHRLVAAGVAGVATVAALGVVNVATPPQRSAPPTTVPAGFAMLMNPACQWPARDIATDVSIFLTEDITADQRSAVNRALDSDRTVRSLRHETPEEALAAYRKMFEDAPELVAAVKASQLPESFRIKLTDRSQYANLTDRVGRLPGVEVILGSDCPVGTNASAAN